MKAFLGTAALAASVGLIGAAAATAAPVTVTCTNTALVRPLLGKPSCDTPVVNVPVPSQGTATVAVKAATLVGLGPSAGSAQFLAFGSPFTGTSCSGPPAGCTATQTIQLRTDVPSVPFQGRCSWEGSSIGVLARVDCSLTIDMSPIAT